MGNPFHLPKSRHFPWICVVFFTAVKNCFTSDENTLSKKKDISCPTTSQTNCSVNRMICSRFLSDYLEIFSAAPRKSLDNHSKTSHRSSGFPHSFFEVVEHEKYYFSWQPSSSSGFSSLTGDDIWLRKEISYFHVLRLRKNCEENRMICERFLSDYREIFEAQLRKSRDNHSKTSNRSSCLPNSLLEKS